MNSKYRNEPCARRQFIAETFAVRRVRTREDRQIKIYHGKKQAGRGTARLDWRREEATKIKGKSWSRGKWGGTRYGRAKGEVESKGVKGNKT
ncbi:hypothetical protein E2C01_077155 [Portunus trituberculatus]|uniref:Uncharacterized protein n=1 Tax=Portunus trituberculatus TaxID=210409 RepID=A0A5B7IJH7_PORTR|nr:hypothetical protein [Portunus trituberculatus]